MKKVSQLLLTLLLFSCSPKILNTEGGSIINQMNGYYSNNQLDSMCISDTLPSINNWEQLYLKEDETKENILIYVCSKNNVIYKVEQMNSDSVKIIKRIIK